VVTSPALERSDLRPIERRVLRLVDTGVDVDEIGKRFRRSPEHIERLIQLAELPGRSSAPHESRLRPLERCILGWRAKGASHDEIAPRLHKTSGFVARVEEFAQHKLRAGTGDS
jgi:DNA-binding NarL/FixJ family response regulator